MAATTALDDVVELLVTHCTMPREAGAAPVVVNVVGALGSGKTTLLAALRGQAPGARVIDDVDTPESAETALSTVLGDPVPPTVVASRVPLVAFRRWAAEVRVLPARVGPWSDDAIRALVRDDGVRDDRAPDDRVPDDGGPGTGVLVDGGDADVIVRLAGGAPLIADTAARAVAAGVTGEAALADAVATEVLLRLRRECPDPWFGSALTALAVLGTADGDLLTDVGAMIDETCFERLRRTSVVVAESDGLRVVEPYRRILDLGCAWRRPIAHRRLRRRAAADRRRRLGWADGPDRGPLLAHSVFLLGDRTVHDALYLPPEPRVSVRAATAADGDAVMRLVDLWAHRGGLDRRRSERLHGAWLADAPDGFALAVDRDGRAIGLGHAVSLRAGLVDHAEPMLQQHAATLLADDPDAVLVGLAISEDGRREAHSAVLRHVLGAGLRRGRIIVTTPWPPYQRLCTALGFTAHGATYGDVYDRGRTCDVFSQSFSVADVAAWLDRLGGGPVSARGFDAAAVRADVAEALQRLDDPVALAASRLGALPAVASTGSPGLALRAGIDSLASSTDPTVAEAGRVLDAYYVRRAGSHTVIARDLHLSRATYFRRLRAGVAALAAMLQD